MTIKSNVESIDTIVTKLKKLFLIKKLDIKKVDFARL